MANCRLPRSHRCSLWPPLKDNLQTTVLYNKKISVGIKYFRSRTTHLGRGEGKWSAANHNTRRPPNLNRHPILLHQPISLSVARLPPTMRDSGNHRIHHFCPSNPAEPDLGRREGRPGMSGRCQGRMSSSSRLLIHTTAVSAGDV